jgi:uncharacterized protein
MKFRQEFRVAENLATVWAVFEQPARVAACLPGLESCEALEDGTLAVRLTQRLGPMAATFEARVRITERVPGERIQFTSTGKAVRGAVGSFRATNTVYLQAADNSSTAVVVEGEAALAGMLGSVAQKIIMKQADKMTTEFAKNLEHMLSGAAAALVGGADAIPGASGTNVPSGTILGRPTADLQRALLTMEACVRWAKVSAALSGAATLVGLAILWRMAAHS